MIRGTESSEERLLSVEVGGGEGSALPSDEAGASHADGNGLAVKKVTVAGRRFERVADRVTVVQDNAQSGLTLVGPDDLSLELNRAADDIPEQHRILEPEQRLGVRFEGAEQVGVA